MPTHGTILFAGREAAGAVPYDPAVPHIRLIDPEDAEGLLAEEYAAAVERAGKVYNIVRSMSPNPAVLRQSMKLYGAIMFGPSGLTRQERELLATVVSAANECYY
jgi:alkylhydroperoxidase family enzyme